MSSLIIDFIVYQKKYYDDCLHLFDENCPTFFAINERQDYLKFLDSNPSQYYLVKLRKAKQEGGIVSGFGLMFEHNIADRNSSRRGRLSWMLVMREAHRMSIGSSMMEYGIKTAKEQSLVAIDIAASHLSAPFFSRFGACTLCKIPNGWGEGMHKVDMEIVL